MRDLKPHPLLNELDPPKMTKEEFAEFVAKVKRRGVTDPIVVMGEFIMDGRHRYNAAKKAGIDCPERVYDGPQDDEGIIDWIESRRDRKHESPSERAAAAVRHKEALDRVRAAAVIDKSKNGANLHHKDTGRTAEIAAKSAGVSTRQVATLAAVKRADPDEFEKVARGEKSVNAAAKAVKEKAEPESPEPIKDANGTEIPERLADAFNDARFEEIASQLRAVKKNIKALADGPLAVWLHQQDVLGNLENVIKAVKFSRPHALCPYCRPAGCKGCKACRKSGWMPVEVYAAVPEADK